MTGYFEFQFYCLIYTFFCIAVEQFGPTMLQMLPCDFIIKEWHTFTCY